MATWANVFMHISNRIIFHYFSAWAVISLTFPFSYCIHLGIFWGVGHWLPPNLYTTCCVILLYCYPTANHKESYTQSQLSSEMKRSLKDASSLLPRRTTSKWKIKDMNHQRLKLFNIEKMHYHVSAHQTWINMELTFSASQSNSFPKMN